MPNSRPSKFAGGTNNYNRMMVDGGHACKHKGSYDDGGTPERSCEKSPLENGDEHVHWTMGKTTRHSTTRHDAAKLSHGENTKELQREYGWIGGLRE